MSFVVRCPACGTAFVVHKAQLAAHDGEVRCGKCATVFNGVSALLEDGADGSGSAAEPAGDAAHDAEAVFAAKPPEARFALLWGFLALIALLALVGQLVLQLRTELATQWPAARAPLAAACDLVGCELRLPRRIELLSIESSDVQPDRSRDSVIVLNAVVRNRAPFAQAHPALELTLTDERDYALLRRVLRPAEYLGGAEALRAHEGIAGGAEAVIRLHLESAGARAAGYRLYLFFPPDGA